MRSTSFSQKTLTVNESSRLRVQSPSPPRVSGRSFSSEVHSSSSRGRGREGFEDSFAESKTEVHIHRPNEKEELQELNNRFAGYIDKVRSLEQKNQALQEELEELTKQLKERGPCISEEYEKEFKDLKDLIEKLTQERGLADIERGNLEEEIEIWNAKCEEELSLKEEAEKTLREFRQDVDDATLQKLDLERRVEQLVDEIEFLKKLHDEEVADLLRQIEESKVNVQLESDRPDLAAALRALRAQIEQATAKNIQDAEKWYKSKFNTLKGQVSKNEEKIKTIREEISKYSSQVSDLQSQIDSLRSINEALEKQLEDIEAKHLEEVVALQEIIAQLEGQLLETKSDLARYLQDYQDLLNIKLRLDAEIAVYRKLLEGEEQRLGMTAESEVRGDNSQVQTSVTQKVETRISSHKQTF